MATPVCPPLPIGLWAILSESKRIINAHSRHFLALSVLFLLPLSFSISVSQTVLQLLSQSSTPSLENHISFLINYPFQQQEEEPPVFPSKILIFYLAYFIFTRIFSLLATGSITYSVLHGFYGRPVKLFSAVKSAFTSFFHLLSTSLVSELIIYGVLLIFGLVLFSLLKAIQLVGFHVNLPSLVAVFVIVSLSIVAYLNVIWVFAYVVVVTESSWGLEPLKRSHSLVKGLKGISFRMLLVFVLLSGIYIFVVSPSVKWGTPYTEWKSWTFILQIIGSSSMLMLIMQYNLAASTVFYMYSKAIHGELAKEIAEEFSREYVSLPFDDGKVPHTVSLLYV